MDFNELLAVLIFVSSISFLIIVLYCYMDRKIDRYRSELSKQMDQYKKEIIEIHSRLSVIERDKKY
jgi:hypothetical protein